MGEINLAEFGKNIGLFYIPFLFSLCFHEYAHGLVAKWKGDNTADLMGRLTMNPIAHMDMVGTVILPMFAMLMPMGLFFGWAKPVPVNSRNLDSPTEDMFWIALAGPLSNVLLAILGAIAFGVATVFMHGHPKYGILIQVFQMFIGINLVLALFNMIPLHPLDGGKVLARFLPYSVNRWLEENSALNIPILLIVFISGIGAIIFAPAGYIQAYLMAGSQYLFLSIF